MIRLALLLVPFLALSADLVRTWQGIPGLERTPKGRIFVSWFSGGTREPAPENSALLSYSDDGGATFRGPVVMAGPRDGSRAFDPALWRDPSGRLWYIFNRGNRDAARHGVYARICDQPDAREPAWGEEFRIGFAMANEVQPGEAPDWPYIYCTMSVVSLSGMTVERRIPVARGGQAFANETLPEGACFVPRILRKDAGTLRVFFASEAPHKREAQTYYLDFDLARQAFSDTVGHAQIQTAAGTFDMQPRRFYDDAAAQGFTRERQDYGLYTIDSFKVFDGKTYVAMNNFPGGQNALAVLNGAFDTFQVLGHYNPRGPEKLTESAVNRLPDGTWMAICRQDGGTGNYMFTTSPDGRAWTPPAYREFVPNGTNSKPVFEKFGGVYYLGWQESTRVGGVSRSVFNIDVSRDGSKWTRRYRFESERSFQYPSLHEYRSEIFLTVTQGDSSPSRKERILFGKLE